MRKRRKKGKRKRVKRGRKDRGIRKERTGDNASTKSGRQAEKR